MNKLLPSIIILAIFGATAIAGRAHTASPPTPRGITVTPAFQQVNIATGSAQQPVNFSVTNNEPKAQTLDISTADFNTLNESGGLFFVGTNPTALQKKYGLAKWLSLSQKQLTLAPKQNAVVTASVLNLPDLAPGGHYGAILLGISNADSGQPNNKISLHPIASALMFVTKLGGDTHRLGLDDVSFNHKLFKLPGSVTLRFHNKGNTHLVPRGVVSLIGPGGKLAGKGIINDSSSIILPETFRQYYVPLQTTSAGSKPGTYKLKVDFRFDGISQFRSYSKSFKYLPAYILGVVILIIFVAGLAWRYRHNIFKPQD